MNKLLLTFPLALIMLSGCGDPKDATESNFKKAAQAYLDTQYPHCYITVNFPFKSDVVSFNHLPEILHIMAGKGMVKETETSRKHIPASWAGKERDIVVNSYDLTEEGKKYYKPDAARNMKGEALGGFCFGRATVDTVDNFTEPSDALGQKISRVAFSYKVTDIPDWAGTPELLDLDRRLKEDMASGSVPLKKNGIFILTGKGWMHERLFGK
ncbi:hypothetical protein FHU12_5273 [Serratia marcescens]|uniref:Lipoprotein n=1 Tax=Serratia marcescens TaxID=615 RepID=A0AA46KAN8_SERMA|nr:hypothetical protein [Serratia marcescens]TQI87574.1 hypothetical protein FHU12_5273 [Serratia marcescens]